MIAMFLLGIVFFGAGLVLLTKTKSSVVAEILGAKCLVVACAFFVALGMAGDL
jgi:hypothetical protein